MGINQACIQNKGRRAEDIAQLSEGLPSRHEVLILVPSIA